MQNESDVIVYPVEDLHSLNDISIAGLKDLLVDIRSHLSGLLLVCTDLSGRLTASACDNHVNLNCNLSNVAYIISSPVDKIVISYLLKIHL